jgi:N6-adenosine-specific RNA methylase IME4
MSHLEKGGMPPVPQKRKIKPPLVQLERGLLPSLDLAAPTKPKKVVAQTEQVVLDPPAVTKAPLNDHPVDETAVAAKALDEAIENYRTALSGDDDDSVTVANEVVGKARVKLREAKAQAASAKHGGLSYAASAYPMLQGMPQGLFNAILIDPPFRYARACGSGVAENHYETLSDADLAALPVGALAAQDSMLFLWCSGPTMSRAVALCESWGFNYKTVAFVWIKTKKDGAPHGMGLGSYTRPGAEYVLVAGKGKAASLVTARPNQVFLSPRRAHSEKPLETRAFIDELLAGETMNKIELFCRSAPDAKWSVWGDQLGTK